MSEITEQVANIIAEIYTGSRSGKLKFIIGDGIYPQEGIKSRADIVEHALSSGKKRSSDIDEDRWCWQIYERYRWRSANVLPSKNYFYLYHLCRDNTVNAIITTNYDLYIDSIFTKYPLPQGYVLNPLIKHDGDYDGDDFYGKVSGGEKLHLWKIHGSFSHISFITSNLKGNNSHIFKLPRILMGYPENYPTVEYGLPSHNFLNNTEANCNCNRMAHFTDMSFKRELFLKPIISGATLDLQDDNTAGIIIVGLTGQHDPANPQDERNEELVPLLIELAKKIPVYLILSPRQKNDSYLYRMLTNSMQGEVIDIFRRIFMSYYKMTGRLISPIDDEYQREWAYGDKFSKLG